MTAIICIDEKTGMLFNNRRQSKDSTVREKILSLSENGSLFMNSYSAKQFEESKLSKINIDEKFFEHSQDDDFCFFENCGVSSYIDDINKFVVFKWNRNYPADFYLDFLPWENNWQLKESQDFEGTSHEKITMEVYEK